MHNKPHLEGLLEKLWSELGGAPERLSSLEIHGPEELLPSVYPVSDFAAATVGLASLAVAEWAALGNQKPLEPVSVDRAHAAIAFRSERYLERPGRPWPSLWDAMAGDYATRDGFIRLHTNYPHHRAAAEQVLGSGDDRKEIERQVASLWAADLETAVVEAGGCAAAMQTPTQWARHPQGSVVLEQPSIEMIRSDARESVAPLRSRPPTEPARPLAGVRVLDLTRVIAGPTCTRVLAAWGAEVLRVDPVGFEESEPLLADTTVGKRCTELDLRLPEHRARFESLLAETDILVTGYRSDALAGLGYDAASLQARNPALVIAALDAYGFHGPWRARRGFDSLVQMSCGIASRGQVVFGTPAPKPLPAQALDHGSGYLLAAAACRALCEARGENRIVQARLSLAGTAKALMAMGENGDPGRPEPDSDTVEPFLVAESGAFGAIRRICCPGRIGEAVPRWNRAAGPIGRDEACWPAL